MERYGICHDCGLVAKRYVMAGRWLCRPCFNKRIESNHSGRMQYGRPVKDASVQPFPLKQPCRSDDGRRER